MSPLIHIQQCNARGSRHWPFTPDLNAEGDIHPEKLLQAIADSGAEHEMLLALEVRHRAYYPDEYRLEDNLRRSVEYCSSMSTNNPSDVEGLAMDYSMLSDQVLSEIGSMLHRVKSEEVEPPDLFDHFGITRNGYVLPGQPDIDSEPDRILPAMLERGGYAVPLDQAGVSGAGHHYR